jgi:hypothetical protein
MDSTLAYASVAACLACAMLAIVLAFIVRNISKRLASIGEAESKAIADASEALKQAWSATSSAMSDANEAWRIDAQSATTVLMNQAHANETAMQAFMSRQDTFSKGWQSQLTLINGKLDRIEGTAKPFIDSPLNHWTFREYRQERERLQQNVRAKVDAANTTSKVKLGLHTGELALITELVEKSGIKAGIQKAFEEWTSDPTASVVLMIPAALSCSLAATQYIPCFLAILHYFEERHVQQQLKTLGQQYEYLLHVREGEEEAALHAHWNFARSLLRFSNPALARLGLREVCRTLEALRHSHLSESVDLFERSAQPVDRKNSFSVPQMNRCLRTIDRLIDAILLEFYIHIALGEADVFIKKPIPEQLAEVKKCLRRCYEVRAARIKSAVSREQALKILLPLKTAPMRLRAYRTLLKLIAHSGGTQLPLPLSAPGTDRPRPALGANGRHEERSDVPAPFVPSI